MGLFDIASNVLCVCLIPIVGKRNIMLIGLTGVVIFCFGIAVNAYYFINPNTSSFVLSPMSVSDSKDNSYGLVLFICFGVSASISGSIPWVMNGEVYPFR